MLCDSRQPRTGACPPARPTWCVRRTTALTTRRTESRRLLALLLAASLVACGGGSGDDPAPPQPPEDVDAWAPVEPASVASACGLDPNLLAEADRQLDRAYAIVRYGKLCHEYYPAGSGGIAAVDEIWSATKTLGAVVTGIAAYETRDLPRTGRKTGPLSDGDRVDHWIDEFSFNHEAKVAHVLGMVAHNAELDFGTKSYSYDGFGTEQINRLNDVVRAAIAQDAERLGRDLEEFTQRFLFEPLGMRHSQWSAGAPDKLFAVGWVASLRDMARLGLLLVRGGVWEGRRILTHDWVYRMTHPSFEDANTGYGYLTWLNAASNWTYASSTDKQQGPRDACSPVAVHRVYPHESSGAPDCGYSAPYRCEQVYDAGVWWAEGAYGQLIVGHPGLDLVLVVKNLPDDLRPTGVWDAVRPALVALDPEFRGDETAFCAAYARNEYAPDLGGRSQPADPIVEELAAAGHVLWVGAHPDDEIVQAALLGELGAERGVKLTFLVATGWSGECLRDVPPDECSEMTVRSGEMAASAAALQGGEASVVQLGLPDGAAGYEYTGDPARTVLGWDEAAGGHDRLVASVRAAIEAISPGAVILQDPRHGDTCHPDHRATGSLVIEALLQMGVDAPPAYLSETVMLSSPPGTYGFFGAAEPADPSLIRYDATRFGAAIDGETWTYTVAAIEAHRSQFAPALAAGMGSAPPENRRNYLIPLSGAWPSMGYPGCDERCPISFGYGPAGGGKAGKR